MNNDNRNLGAAIGVVLPGRAEIGVAEGVNPKRDVVCWTENFSGRNDVEHHSSFDDLVSEN